MTGAGARPLRLVQDKPVPPDEQALAGVFVLGPAAIDAALALPDDAGVAEIIGAIGEAGGRLETRIVNGSWKYTGEVDGLLAANRMVLDEIESELAGCDLSQARIEGRVQIHPTAIIERSTIRGPAVIGPGAVLQDAFVGPTARSEPRCGSRAPSSSTRSSSTAPSSATSASVSRTAW